MNRASIEDMHPLSPIQRGLLVESTSAAARDPYVIQMTCDLRGPVRPELLREAWQATIRRHPVLRTSVHWRGMSAPVQVVHSTAEMPFRVVERDGSDSDWQSADRLWATLCEDDRRRGFDLSTAPLTRVTMLHEASDRYRLLWTHHHLVLDGWSTALLLDEVLGNYRALAAGQPPRHDAAPAFSRYLRWLRETDQTRGTARWKALLDGHPGPAPIHGDRSPHAGTGQWDNERDVVTRREQEALMDQVHQWARRHKLSPGGVYHLAWSLAMLAYSGQPDALFGATVSCRAGTVSGSDGILGPLINTVPVRLLVTADRPLRDCLDDLTEQLVLAGPAHHLDLTSIKAASAVTGARPLFDSAIAVENYPADRDVEHRLDGIQITDVRWHGAAGPPLSAVVVPEEGTASVSFHRNRFDEWTAARLLDYFLGCLGAIVALEPGDRVSSVARLVTSGATRDQAGPPARPAHLLFADRVAAAPAALAVIDGGQRLSYGELDRRAAQLADVLRSHGVGNGSRVAVVIESSADLLVGFLAVLRAGAAYVPVNPSDPAARQREIHRSAEPQLTLVRTAGSDVAAWCGTPIIPVDGPASIGADSAFTAPAGGVSPHDPAYIMFTSGSSGAPKGVVIPHRALANYLTWAVDTYCLGPGTVTPMHSSPTFDLSVTALLGPLAGGGAIRFLAPGGGASALIEHFASPSYVGTVKLTPSHLVALQSDRPRDRTDTFVIGGEELRRDVVAQWSADNPGAVFYNEYGPTEATVGCVVHCLAEDRSDTASVPIGTPIAGAGIRVLDDHLRPVPDGVPGELFIAGDCLATGYFGRAGLTAESFLPDVASAIPGARMYRTGDLVRMGPRGLVYLGRKDGQVKIRGFRVESAEIEAKLAGLAGVEAAAVVPDSDHALKAFIVPAGNDRPSAADLVGYLERLLPRHMVPAKYEFLPRLPTSASGKIDRETLAGLQASLAVDSAGYRTPEGPTETALAALWADALEVPAVGGDDDFFALGGDSLLAMTIVALAPAAISGRFTAGDLLTCRTVSALARRIDSAGSRPAIAEVPAARLDDTLTAAQLRFFVLHELDPDGDSYNTAAAVLLRGVLDLPDLRRAVDLLVARHDVLRTSFTTVAGTPAASVQAPCHGQVGFTDLLGLPADERLPEARRRAQASARLAFDLAQAPLLRVEAYATGAGEHILLLVMHHIISDGQSQAILVDELCQIYGALRKGEQPQLPAAVQYAVAARGLVPGDAAASEALTYWRSRLATPLPEALVADKPRPVARRAMAPAEIRFQVDPGLWDEVQSASRHAGVSVFSMLLASLRLSLARFYGVTGEIAIGTPVSLRETAELGGVVGPLLNTLVLRRGVDLDQPVGDLLRAEQEVVAQAMRHKGVPFEDLVREFARSDDHARSPLFDILLDFQRVELPAPGRTGLAVTEFDLGPRPARFDLQVDVWESAGHVSLRFTYRDAIFDSASMRALAEAYLTVLTGLAKGQQARAGDVALATAQPPARGGKPEGHGATRDYGPQFLVPELIREQVARTPAAIAVEMNGEQVSYRDIDDASDRWAARLAASGVGPEVRVGVLLDRCPDLIVTALAILKAGGVYLPLDPGFPDERLRYIIADSAPALVLSDSQHASRISQAGPPVLLADDADQVPPPPLTRPALRKASAAYILYTSGSTGQPKGVVISHEALANRLLWAQDHFGLTASDRVLHKTPVGFDVSVWELFWPLLAGSTIVLAAPGGHRDPEYLARLVRDARVTTVHFVPSLLRGIVDAGLLAECTALTRIICSGEVLPAALYEDTSKAAPARVHNLYGPTEAAIDVTWWTAGDGPVPPRLPIGWPVANTTIYVLDDKLREQPAHALGELCIGGVQVGRGYLGRPGLTADRFRPDPFSALPGQRLYRTGDIARVRADGAVDFIGRDDDQVKIRGQRVEIGEVESVLSRHQAVLDCAVRVVDSVGGGRLQACYVRRGPVDGAELAGYAERFLPQVMVPSVWTEVDQIPRTASGKVDRAALPAADPLPAGSRPYTAPAPGPEEVLARVWRQVLGTEAEPGRDDSFFAAGGDSIVLLRLVAQVADAGLRLTVADVFEAPTLAGMAARVTTAPVAEDAADVPFALLGERDPRGLPESAVDAYPMTALQTGMVFHTLDQPRTRLYKNFDSVLLRARFDHAALSAVVRLLVARHPVLRTSFDLDIDGAPIQIVHGSAPCDIEVTDLRAMDEAAGRREFRAWADQQLEADWDFAVPPLIRFHVHLLSEDTFRLSLPHHHAILDGWSLSSLAVELVSAYLTIIDGREPTLTPTDRNGFRWHVAQELRARDDAGSRDFWAQALAEVRPGPLLSAPADRSRHVCGPHHTARSRIAPQHLTTLRAWSAERGLSLKSTLFAVHCAVLAAASSRADLVTGMTVHGRSADDSGLAALGLFLNSLPMPVSVDGLSWADLAREAFDLERAVMPHRHMPMEALRHAHDTEVLFDTLFNFTNFHLLAGVLQDPASDSPYEIVDQESHTTSSIPLVTNVDLDPSGTELSVAVTADPSMLAATDVEALADLFQSGVTRLLSDPDGPAWLETRAIGGFAAADADLYTSAEEIDLPAFPVPATTPVQELLQQLWADVLDIEIPGVTDDFFQLGGHSLAAMRLKIRIQLVFGVEIPLATILDRPRLADLAAAIEATAAGVEVVASEPMPAEPLAVVDGGPAAAGWAQVNFWDIASELSAVPLFNMPMAVMITGELRAEEFLNAVRIVVDRHEALRTHLAEVDGELVQIVAPAGGFRPLFTDLRDLTADQRALKRAERERAAVLWPFDLRTGPLVHAELVRLATNKWLFLLSLHHAIADGWSVGVITDDIAITYHDQVAGRAPSRAEPSAIQYRDVAHWQRDQLREGHFAPQIDYWRKQLAAPLAPMELGTDRPRERAWCLRSATVNIVVPDVTLTGLKAVARARHATLFMVLVTQFARLLRDRTGHDDVRIGTLSANRSSGAVTDTVGLLANPLALRFDLAGADTFDAALSRVRDTTFGAFAHQAIPFEALLGELALASESRQSLFRHQLVLQTAPMRLPQLSGVTVEPVTLSCPDGGVTATTLDLSLTLAERGEGLTGWLTYRPDLFDQSTVEAIAAKYVASLAEAADQG